MKTLLTCFITLLVAGAAFAQQAPEIARFSTMKAGAAPRDWKPFALSPTKKKTEYVIATDDGVTVLRATAHGAASALVFPTDFDPRAFPTLSWRWKVVQGIPDAHNGETAREDSPVRVMVSFDGDSSKLTVKDKIASSFAQSQSGQSLPYATVMYIWGNKIPINKVISSPRTARIRMIPLNVDEQGIGAWHSFTRNLVEDYKMAFGEDPGKVTGIQVLSDTDNTGGDSDAFYGDISVGAAK